MTAAPPFCEALPDARSTFEALAHGVALKADRIVSLQLARPTVANSSAALPEATSTKSCHWAACAKGYCGTCETKVLDGAPDHRNIVLSDAERRAARS